MVFTPQAPEYSRVGHVNREWMWELVGRNTLTRGEIFSLFSGVEGCTTKKLCSFVLIFWGGGDEGPATGSSPPLSPAVLLLFPGNHRMLWRRKVAIRTLKGSDSRTNLSVNGSWAFCDCF